MAEQLPPAVLKAAVQGWQAVPMTGRREHDRDVAFLALGSNLPFAGQPPARLMAAARALLEQALGPVLGASALYRSPACPAGAGPDYLNAVLAFRVADPPEAVLDRAHAVEAQLGRQRAVRWAARSLDADLIAQGGAICPDRTVWLGEADRSQAPQRLILPHPRAHQRLFVMAPLAEMAPDWCHPVLGRKAAALAAALEQTQACERLAWPEALALHG